MYLYCMWIDIPHMYESTVYTYIHTYICLSVCMHICLSVCMHTDKQMYVYTYFLSL